MPFKGKLKTTPAAESAVNVGFAAKHWLATPCQGRAFGACRDLAVSIRPLIMNAVFE